MAETVELHSDDPFDATLISILRINRRKRQDYAQDDDLFSNFKDTAALLGMEGFGTAEAALFNCLQKIVRLKSLRTNGRMTDVANEAVDDTYLDLAVYSVLLYAIVRSDGNASKLAPTPPVSCDDEDDIQQLIEHLARQHGIGRARTEKMTNSELDDLHELEHNVSSDKKLNHGPNWYGPFSNSMNVDAVHAS